MKILILADRMQTGGAETHIYELSRSLLSLSHEVVVLSHGGDMAKRLQKEDIRHIQVPRMGSIRSIYCIIKTIRNEKPTILHAHTRKTAFICRLLAPFLSVPCVFTAHAKFKATGLGRLIRLFRGRTIAVSDDIARHMQDAFGFQKENITVIGNGIDIEFFAPRMRKKGGEIRILTVSRLDRDCALAATLLLRLLPLLRQSFHVTLTVVGGGNALPEIEKAAKKVTGVTLAGAQSDVRPYIADCDIFVGVSRAALEAMAMEKPVILCGNEGYLGLLDEVNITLAEQSNFCARGYPMPTAEVLLHDLTLLLCRTAQQRHTLGQYCRTQVQFYHAAIAMAKETLAVYCRALHDYQRFDILLCGYYGFGNLGDELVLRALAYGLHAIDSSLRIAALMGNGEPPDGVFSIPRNRPFAVLQAIRRSGITLLGGGTLLQNATSRRSLYYYLSLLCAARRRGKPYGILLGGMGPIQTPVDRKRVARILGDASFIGLRDSASVALLAEMGISSANIHVGADPVLCLPLPDIARIPQYLTVFPRRGDGQNKLLTDALAHLSAQYSLPICIGIMDVHEDRNDAELLLNALSAEWANDDIYTQICRSRLILTSRLHALILAYRNGVPAVAISDDPKLSAFLHEAFPKNIAAALSLPARPSKHALLSACRFALAQSAEKSRLDTLCRRCERQFTLLVEKVGKWENFH